MFVCSCIGSLFSYSVLVDLFKSYRLQISLERHTKSRNTFVDFFVIHEKEHTPQKLIINILALSVNNLYSSVLCACALSVCVCVCVRLPW